jgi:hypothetical protein
VNDCPRHLVTAQGRFGNVAFRTWLEQAKAISRPFLESLGLAPERVAELEPYVAESFGNKTRIDYGTGFPLRHLHVVIHSCTQLCLCLIFNFLRRPRVELCGVAVLPIQAGAARTQ